MSNEIINDSQGKPSSKRIAGFVLLVVGLLFLLSVGITSIFKVVADPATTISIGQTIIYIGAGLLGIGVVEKLGGNNNANGNTGN